MKKAVSRHNALEPYHCLRIVQSVYLTPERGLSFTEGVAHSDVDLALNIWLRGTAFVQSE